MIIAFTHTFSDLLFYKKGRKSSKTLYYFFYV